MGHKHVSSVSALTCPNDWSFITFSDVEVEVRMTTIYIYIGRVQFLRAVWWSSANTYKNAITNELFLLTSASGYLRNNDQMYLDNAKKVLSPLSFAAKSRDWLFSFYRHGRGVGILGLWSSGLATNNTDFQWVAPKCAMRKVCTTMDSTPPFRPLAQTMVRWVTWHSSTVSVLNFVSDRVDV